MFDQEPRERCVWKTTKSAFPTLGAPMSPAFVHGHPHVEDLVLPNSLKSCNFTLAKAVIRWMSGKAPCRDFNTLIGGTATWLRWRAVFKSILVAR
jgi:hypothetical protein